MNDSGPFDLATTRYVLSPDNAGIPSPVTADFYETLQQEFGDFAGHCLVQQYGFDQPWPTWEVHPHGDEFVLLLTGAADFILWRDGLEESLRVDRPGQFVVVPRGIWHTARPCDHAEMLFITPGQGTQNAERPTP